MPAHIRPTCVLLFFGLTLEAGVAQEKLPKPAPGIPGLLSALKRDKTWDMAAGQLVLVGEPAIDALAKSLTTANAEANSVLTQRILVILDRMGLRAQRATPVLLTIMPKMGSDDLELAWRVLSRICPIGDPQTFIRANQMRAATIRRNGGWNRRLVTRMASELTTLKKRTLVGRSKTTAYLLTMLREDPANRVTIYQLLGSRGKASRPAIPTVFDDLVHRAAIGTMDYRRRTSPNTDHIRLSNTAAAEAILAIDPHCREAALAYGYLINHETIRSLKLRAARELQMLGAHVVDAVPMLLQYLREEADRDPEVLGIVLNCLMMAGTKANGAVPFVEKLTESESPKIAARAVAVLKRIRLK